MVKQKKLLRDDDDAKVQKTVTVVTKNVKTRKHLRGKRRLRAQALRMLSQKHAQTDAEGVGGGGGGGVGGVGVSDGSVTPGSIANGEGSKEFLSTGRTGRRNALPDILGQHADTGTADLPSRLEALTTDSQHDEPGTSGMSSAGVSTTQQPQQMG